LKKKITTSKRIELDIGKKCTKGGNDEMFNCKAKRNPKKNSKKELLAQSYKHKEALKIHKKQTTDFSKNYKKIGKSYRKEKNRR
jgi:hypothetical protein